jgi:uracil-DNA glycosylase
MPLDPETKRALAGRIEYYRELGIHDFYRRDVSDPPVEADQQVVGGASTENFVMSNAVTRDRVEASSLAVINASATELLRQIRDDIGDCKRCRLHAQRTNIVFGTGNPDAELMFIGEGPGADEDAQGLPFVGRAGQLLNNMITAMGLRREDVYIANVVKCRPPGNRTPERDECDTCGPFLMRQVAAIRPKVIVALGATSAKYLLGLNDSMGNLRGRWYEFTPSRESLGGAAAPDPVKLAVTYHPAYLLRDPRQKAETWKDLQMVMKELGLKPPAKSS